MSIKTKTINILGFVFALTLSVLMLCRPEICKSAVGNAIILCSSVLIPSLFPYTVCMLFIINSDVIRKWNFLTSITSKIFGLSQYPFLIMLFSFIGGFPVGAKLLNDAVVLGTFTPKEGRRMLNYCVNAGPAFVVTVVGEGILHSKSIGYILLTSHLLSSIIICIFSPKIIKTEIKNKKISSQIDSFVASVSSASASILSICFFVIFFAVITAYLRHYSPNLPMLSFLANFLEITTAVTQVKNIYLISFLLGFSGICIWFQVLSVAKLLKINVIKFALARIIHGSLSVVITYILFKIFPVNIPTFSNTDYQPHPIYIPNTSLSIAIIIFGIILVISLIDKEKNAKILEDII